MGFLDTLNAELREFIAGQKLFFVSTADKTGRINLSPKGLDSFRCLSDTEVAFMNLSGSGNETAAHLLVDGRITFMFCSFDTKPLILRLYGRGRSIHARDEEWDEMVAHFPRFSGERQIIAATIDSVQTSCGYGVPRYSLEAERPTLNRYWDKKDEGALEEYWREKNALSIDGLETGLFNDDPAKG